MRVQTEALGWHAGLYDAEVCSWGPVVGQFMGSTESQHKYQLSVALYYLSYVFWDILSLLTHVQGFSRQHWQCFCNLHDA